MKTLEEHTLNTLKEHLKNTLRTHFRSQCISCTWVVEVELPREPLKNKPSY